MFDVATKKFNLMFSKNQAMMEKSIKNAGLFERLH